MSNISENIYYLKEDALFKIENEGRLRSISLDEIIQSKTKYSLLIDDQYFFYIGMDSVSVTGKKLRDIVGNYLNIMFPGEMVKSFGVYQNKGSTAIFILSDELISIIKEHRELFLGAKRISSAFIELSSRYEDFVFSDGTKSYKKAGSSISPISGNQVDYIFAFDLFQELSEVKNSIQLPGAAVSKFSKAPLIMPVALLALCYIIFVAGGISSALSIKKVGSSYDASLTKIYNEAGVGKSKDPIGMLMFKAGEKGKESKGVRVMNVLSDISTVKTDNITFNSFGVRDGAVRIDGVATDFGQVDSLKKRTEEKLNVKVTMDDTKKTEKGVSFIMRYEQ